jgi:cardiolipin synthase A/B
MKGVAHVHIFAYLLGLLTIINILLALAIVFLERRDASVTWAWLLVLVFIPVAGFIVYLLFGRKLSGKIFTWDTKSRLGVKKQVQAQLRAIEENTFSYRQPAVEEYKGLAYMHLRNDDAILTHSMHFYKI